MRPSALPQLAAIPGVSATDIIPTPYDDHLLTTKIDQKITEAQSIFYRFSMQKNSSPNDQIGVPAASDLTNGNTNDNKSYSFVGSHTWTISPTKLNQFSFHYQDFNNFILGVTDAPNLVFPTVQSGRNVNVPQATLVNKYQFRDDFSWTAGDHALKMGMNYIHTRLDGFFFFGAQGYQVTFFDDPLVISTNRIPDPTAPGGFRTGPYTAGFATPGAVRQITFSDGAGDHRQTIHQLAFYGQDDWKVRRNLTFNLGLRWDANIGNLPTQNDNRTIRILQQLNEPRARAITADPEKLLRQTPSFKEFQPRVGFAWDPWGEGRTVIRGGYGIFYDQLFQNLTLFSLTQSNPELYQTIVQLQNTAVGVGQLSTFRFGIDPLPPVPVEFTPTELAFGGFGRINDPDASEPYVQKFSVGFEHQLGRGMTISSDYVHTLGLHEPRYKVINPLIRNICDPLFPGSNPSSPRCVRGANSRYFDQALVAAGFPIRPGPGGDITRGVARVEQINMFSTDNRSLYDSWATTLRRRTSRTTLSASYVLSSSRSWGGQPTASYSGNGIAVAPENQFKPEEFGPTRLDERHRVVVSGVFDLPWDFQLAPILQYASARPYSLNSGLDLDGDGLTTNDRICEGTDPAAVFAARGNATTLQALNPRGCRQVRVNSARTGFIVDLRDPARPVLEERSGRFFNVDLRAQKTFRLGERSTVKGYLDFFNLFNTENLSFASRLGISPATARDVFRQPISLYGPGFGPPVGRPFTLQIGARVDF